MKFYLAPMEGITGYVYRNAYDSVFAKADKYFTPFIATNQNHTLKTRELKDVLPEHNQGMTVVPQLLSNHAGDFVLMAARLEQLGYREVNLNLGCPSGTVAAKKKGSGFLAFPEELDRFFDHVFTELAKHSSIRVSVKTRLGKEQPEEIFRLIETYNRYPVSELIIHPRIQRDFYKNSPRLEFYEQAAALSVHPVCYNGDIFSASSYQTFCSRFPQTGQIMLGRGVITDPSLIGRLKNPGHASGIMTRQKLRAFHDRLYDGYLAEMRDERNTLFKMKEVWSYLSQLFEDSAKDLKRIRKAESAGKYQAAVNELFEKPICSPLE